MVATVSGLNQASKNSRWLIATAAMAHALFIRRLCRAIVGFAPKTNARTYSGVDIWITGQDHFRCVWNEQLHGHRNSVTSSFPFSSSFSDKVHVCARANSLTRSLQQNITSRVYLRSSQFHLWQAKVLTNNALYYRHFLNHYSRLVRQLAGLPSPLSSYGTWGLADSSLPWPVEAKVNNGQPLHRLIPSAGRVALFWTSEIITRLLGVVLGRLAFSSELLTCI